MAKDVRFLISAGVQRAESSIRELQRTGSEVAHRLERDFEQLGTTSSLAFENKRKAAESAYKRIEASGIATQDELTRAQKALSDRLVSLDEEQFGKRTSLLQKFKANWLGVTAAIGAATATSIEGFQMARDAAQGLAQQQGFANLAASHGQAADRIVDDLRQVSARTISTAALVEKAGTAMLLGIPADKLSGLMEIARASSRITGQSISDSFSDIALAVGRGSAQILDNLGIIVNVERANEAYAEKLKKTASQLSETEKKQAFLNEVLRAGGDAVKRIGLESETQLEKIQQFEARLADLRETAGRGLLGAMQIVSGIFQGVAGSALLASAGVFKLVEGLARLFKQTDAAEEFRVSAEAAFEAGLDLGEKAAKSISGGFDLITGKIDPLKNGMAQLSTLEKEAAASVQKKAEVLKSAEAGLSSYSNAVATLGREELRLSGERFSAEMTRQAEAFEQGRVAAQQLVAPVREYLDVIDRVYGAQAAAQRTIAATLQEIGAGQQAVMQQNIAIANTEKAQTAERLKVWSDYLGQLTGMHSQAYGEIMTRQRELFQVRSDTNDLTRQVQQSMMSPVELYYDKLQALDEKASLAMQLGGDEKIRLLQQVQQQWAGMASEIKDGDQVMVGQAQAVAIALQEIRGIGAEIEAEKLAQIGAAQGKLQGLETAMQQAQAAAEGYRQQLVELDNLIAGMNREVALVLNDQASAGIESIRSKLDSLQDKTITITTRILSGGAGNAPSAMDFSQPLFPGSYAVGTRYVPATGLYQLHRGEEVRTRGEVAASSQGGQSIIIQGGITVQLPNVRSADQSSAREMARAIWPELQLLRNRYRSD